MDKGPVAIGGYGGRDVNGARGGILPSELGNQWRRYGSGLPSSGGGNEGVAWFVSLGVPSPGQHFYRQVAANKYLRDESESII